MVLTNKRKSRIMKQRKPDYCQRNKAIIKTGQPLSRRRRADALSSAGSSARNKNITHKLKKMGVIITVMNTTYMWKKYEKILGLYRNWTHNICSALPTMLTSRELGILLVLNEPVKWWMSSDMKTICSPQYLQGSVESI